MIRLDFGFLPKRLNIDAGSVGIETLGFDAQGFLSVSTRVDGDWIYPPLTPAWMSNNDLWQRHIGLATLFTLPSTHTLVLTQDSDEDLAHFLVLTIGVLEGIHLVPDGIGHFYRTAIKPGRLVDFLLRPSATARVVERARTTYLSASEDVRRNLVGAMHWHLFGPAYLHDFERFGVAYAVLDTCWAIHKKITGAKESNHARRITELADRYELSLPPWAVVSGNKSPLSEARNAYFHESQWGGHPIGFAPAGEYPEIDLELFWFNTRLLLTMVGERSEYTRSPITYQPVLLK